MRFIDKIRQYFYGRYGVDTLYYVMFTVLVLMALVRLFVVNKIVSLVFFLIETAFLVIIIYRMMSKNIYARKHENDVFLKIIKAPKNFILLQKDRIRDIKKCRYRKCPNCKSILRLPPKKGKHTVKCPRCSGRFDVNVWF